jgi:hypothetical protein
VSFKAQLAAGANGAVVSGFVSCVFIGDLSRVRVFHFPLRGSSLTLVCFTDFVAVLSVYRDSGFAVAVFSPASFDVEHLYFPHSSLAVAVSLARTFAD